MRAHDPHDRVTAIRGHPGHETAVGELGHRALAEGPVGSVELCHRRRGRDGGTAVRLPGVRKGLPPSVTIRDEAQPAIALPLRLSHRDIRTRFDRPRFAGRAQPSRTRCRVGGYRQRNDDDGGPVPRHVGVVPCHHGEALCGGIEPGGTVEVVTLSENRFAAAVLAGAQRNHVAPGWRCAVGNVHLAHGHHPRAVRTGTETAVCPALAFGWRGGEGASRFARAALQPHALMGRLHVRERTRRQLRDEAAGTAAIFVDATADTHIGCGEIDHPSFVSADEDHPTAVTGTRLEPVHKRPVGTHVSQRHLSRGRIRGLERRGPPPEW